ncbi:MAG: hypothetical protein JWO03_2668 [Bacteroidetes bacterium]|nr:hypothetical protein [Bacteroidota bacterium]
MEAISIFENKLDVNEEQLLYLIKEQTIHEKVAIEILNFIPIAYCRVLITAPVYSDEYIIYKSESDTTSYSFSADRIYNMILDEYKLRAANGQIKEIGQYSAELTAINKALKNGAELKNLSSGPMYIML